MQSDAYSRQLERGAQRIPAFSDLIYPVFDFAGGLNTRSTMLFINRSAPYSLKPNQGTILDNWIRTSSGGLKTRPGRSKLNTTALAPAVGTIQVRDGFELRKSDGTNYVVVHAGNSLYQVDAAGTTTLLTTVATENTRFHWAIFKDAAYGVDGVNIPLKFDGSSFTQVPELPSTCTVITAFRGRLWALDGSTLRYCADNAGTHWNELTYANNAGSLPLPVTRGQGGTGLLAMWDRLITLSNTQVFQLFGVTPSTFTMSAINFRYGHEASPYGVLASGNDVYFLNRRGVISLSVSMAQSETGDIQTDYISGNIEPSWQAINVNNFSNIVAVDDSMHNCMIIACATDGVNNSIAYVADYYLRDEAGRPTWTRYTNWPFSMMLQVQSLTGLPQVLLGGYDGFIYTQKDTDETDAGVNIPTVLQYVTDLESPGFIKTWRYLVIFANAQAGSMGLSSAFDFGRTVLAQTFTLPTLLGDAIGSFTIGTSAIGTSQFNSKRLTIPGSGRFASFLFTGSISKRITLGGFILYAGVRRITQ